MPRSHCGWAFFVGFAIHAVNVVTLLDVVDPFADLSVIGENSDRHSILKLFKLFYNRLEFVWLSMWSGNKSYSLGVNGIRTDFPRFSIDFFRELLKLHTFHKYSFRRYTFQNLFSKFIIGFFPTSVVFHLSLANKQVFPFFAFT